MPLYSEDKDNIAFLMPSFAMGPELLNAAK